MSSRFALVFGAYSHYVCGGENHFYGDNINLKMGGCLYFYADTTKFALLNLIVFTRDTN